MKVRNILIALCALLTFYATSCSESENESDTIGTIYKAEDYGDMWPFSVKEIEVFCHGYKQIYFRSEGKIYALNGSARSAVQNGRNELNAIDMEEVWLDNPELDGTKIPLLPGIISNALENCKNIE